MGVVQKKEPIDIQFAFNEKHMAISLYRMKWELCLKA